MGLFQPCPSFSLALLIGGLAYAPWVLASHGMFPPDLIFAFVAVGGGSPTIAALIAARLEFGKGGTGYLFGQFLRRGFSKLWFLAAVFIPLALAACASLLWASSGGAFGLELTALAGFLPLLIVSFFMNLWEEIGWRGYALPALQRRCSPLVSSLFVGLFWALWHWPHFAVRDSAMAANYNNSFVWFAVFMIIYSLSYTWIYNSTRGSLLAVSLYHASTNAANATVFVGSGISGPVFPFYFLVVIIFTLIIIFSNPDRWKRVPNNPLSRGTGCLQGMGPAPPSGSRHRGEASPLQPQK